MELQRVAQGNEVKNKPTTLKHVPYNPPVTRALSKSGAMDSSPADPKLLSAHSSAGHDEAETSLPRKRQNRFERKPDEQRHKRRIARSDARSEAIEAALVAREADEAAEAERRKEAAQKKAEVKAEAKAAREKASEEARVAREEAAKKKS